MRIEFQKTRLKQSAVFYFFQRKEELKKLKIKDYTNKTKENRFLFDISSRGLEISMRNSIHLIQVFALK